MIASENTVFHCFIKGLSLNPNGQ